MKKISLAGISTVAAVLLLAVFPSRAQDKMVDPTGTWTWTAIQGYMQGMSGGGGQVKFSLKLAAEGDRLVGLLVNHGFQATERVIMPISDGWIDGNRISFKAVSTNANGVASTNQFTGVVADNTIQGTQLAGAGEWTATRSDAAAPPPAAALSVEPILDVRAREQPGLSDHPVYALVFRIRNAGQTEFREAEVTGQFFKGIVHLRSADGREQQARLQKIWRNRIPALPAGLTEESPNDGDLLSYFPSAVDGTYEVWWTVDAQKSNPLQFIVTDGKIRPVEERVLPHDDDRPQSTKPAGSGPGAALQNILKKIPQQLPQLQSAGMSAGTTSRGEVLGGEEYATGGFYLAKNPRPQPYGPPGNYYMDLDATIHRYASTNDAQQDLENSLNGRAAPPAPKGNYKGATLYRSTSGGGLVLCRSGMYVIEIRPISEAGSPLVMKALDIVLAELDSALKLK